MKQLLIYTRSDRRFSKEVSKLVKIQIDNSLHLGWKRKDILLFTNFDFEYNDVCARVIPNLCYEPDRTNKIPVIVYLLQNKLLPDDIIWYHDFDAYQEHPFTINLKKDLGLTGYGYKNQWNCGSFFFKLSAQDIIELWNSKITPRNRADEKCLIELTNSGVIPPDRYESMNLTYNFGQRLTEFPEVFASIEKPVKVWHFHPNYVYYKSTVSNLEIFMYGKNRFNRPMMSPRLINLFNEHGIQ